MINLIAIKKPLTLTASEVSLEGASHPTKYYDVPTVIKELAAHLTENEISVRTTREQLTVASGHLMFGVGASLTVRLDAHPISGERISVSDADADTDGKTHFYRAEPKFEMSWGGSGRSLSEAAVCIQIYAELMAIGNYISALLERAGLFGEIF
jgi:hypothetical protein